MKFGKLKVAAAMTIMLGFAATQIRPWFDRDTWLVQPSDWESGVGTNRYRMADHMIHRIRRQSLNRAQFIAEYGPPDLTVDEQLLVYELGYQSSWSYAEDSLVVAFSGVTDDATFMFCDIARPSQRDEHCRVWPGWIAMPCRGVAP